MKRTALILTALLVVSLLGACAPAATPVPTAVPTPQPTAVPETPMPTAVPTTPAPTTLYQKILAKGKMVVGTSADYAPYESKDEKGNFVGFDMDMIREVAKRLGVEVEIVDMGFDALITALQEGKIDAVIASMSGTPERRQRAEFTIAYNIDPQVFLAKTDSTINVNDTKDAIAYKVGVQTGTSMDMFMTEEYVKTGLMSEDKLLRYERADQAALDLVAGRIDLVFTNKSPAQDLIEKSKLDVKIIFSTIGNPFGGNRIAVPKGEADFVAALDGVIQKMLDEGFVTKLEEQFLKK